MTFYRRRLPHWHPDGRSLFVTWRLFGSLPRGLLRSAKQQHPKNPGRQFKTMDSVLDQAACGPVWLKYPSVASCVLHELLRGQGELSEYDLHAFVIMTNHVHMLFDPNVALRQITNRIKGVTARKANLLLKRTGQPFWQDESFDHWVRNGREFERNLLYVEQNPVKVGFVAKPEQWPWSKANPDLDKLLAASSGQA